MQIIRSVVWHTLAIPTHEEQLKLRVQPPDLVMRGARICGFDGTTAYELVSIGGAIVALPDDIRQDITAIAVAHGVKLGKATETASYVPADPIVARELQMPAGTSVLRLERVVEIHDGTPIEWRIAYLVNPNG